MAGAASRERSRVGTRLHPVSERFAPQNRVSFGRKTCKFHPAAEVGSGRGRVWGAGAEDSMKTAMGRSKAFRHDALVSNSFLKLLEKSMKPAFGMLLPINS